MDVKTVCLGMLTSGEASGYDLSKQFEASFAHFFSAGYGSIYPALAYLADTGLVTCTEVIQDGKPDRKVYRITDKGRVAFLDALDNPAPRHKIRSEFLATLYFAHLMTPEQIDAVVEHRLGELDELLECLECFEGTEVADLPHGIRFVGGFGLALARAAREYIEANRDLLSNQDDDDRLKGDPQGAKQSAAV